jgi:hypothetical protein
MQASYVTLKLTPASREGCMCRKVIKCDKKNASYHWPQQTPKGSGAKTPPTRAQWLVQNPENTLRVKKKVQSCPHDHGRPGHPLRHECKLHMLHSSSPQLP